VVVKKYRRIEEGWSKYMKENMLFVLAPSSRDVANQGDRRHLAFCHHHGPPSFFWKDREVFEDAYDFYMEKYLFVEK